jgi:hypothetical protein
MERQTRSVEAGPRRRFSVHAITAVGLFALALGVVSCATPAPSGLGLPSVEPSATASSASLPPGGTPLPADADKVWIERAGRIITRLGYVPPQDGTVAHETNRDTGSVDTIVEFGEEWRLEWDPWDVLVGAFRLPDQQAPPIPRMAAPGRISSDAVALGVTATDPPTALEGDDDSWWVAWPRTVGGIPVLGDGSRITIGQDGSFVSYWHLERPLAAKPLLPLSRAEAIAAHARGVPPGGAPPPVTQASLIYAPPVAPGTPAPALRLCWVLTIVPRADVPGASAHIYLDAATGAELWGEATS